MTPDYHNEPSALPWSARSRFMPLPTIVVAGNDHDLRAFVARTLESVGYPVLAFALNERLPSACESNLSEIGAIVLDFELPSMTGLDLLSRIHRLKSSLPTILLSTGSGGHIKRQVSLPPDTAVLQKPFLPAELLVEVDSALRALTLLGVDTGSYSRAVP